MEFRPMSANGQAECLAGFRYEWPQVFVNCRKHAECAFHKRQTRPARMS